MFASKLDIVAGTLVHINFVVKQEKCLKGGVELKKNNLRVSQATSAS